jgi:hypothetical protein
MITLAPRLSGSGTSGPNSASSAGSSNHLGPGLIGAIVGSIVAFIVLSILTFYIIRERRRRANWAKGLENATAVPFDVPPPSPRARLNKTMSEVPPGTTSRPFSHTRGRPPSPVPVPVAAPPPIPSIPDISADPPIVEDFPQTQRDADVVLDPEPPEPEPEPEPEPRRGPRLLPLVPIQEPAPGSPTQASPLSPSETREVRRILALMASRPEQPFPMQGGEAVEEFEPTRRNLIRSEEYPDPPPQYVPRSLDQ